MATEEGNRQAAIERMRELHAAYVSVFGPPGQLSASGAIVLADFERFARFSHSATYRSFAADGSRGAMDPYSTIYNLALQEFVKRIHLRLAWSEGDGHSSSDFDRGE